ncbi:uncharacterized protein KY384_003631 [Bacidia gigantensis]|uniref:uncharacterized protein n=1 Tax=Bacidia gigantensis TaxID=2732470 RepID=UPI001D03B237|nr:uncharacterized protein KY384_003631 [Bacidia gigantensis]KAG8531995.1 hypothetical protein KY384_003631 [Bacidia gigantensis]
MPSTSSKLSYESLVGEYASLSRAHDASILAAKKAKAAFIASESTLVPLMRRRNEHSDRLSVRSETCKAHDRYVKRLSRRLTSMNPEIRAHHKRREMDDVELLSYATCAYQLLHATSLLAAMNKVGRAATARCGVVFDKVNAAKDVKKACDERGEKAYTHHNEVSERMVQFWIKLGNYAAELDPDPDSDINFRLDQWMDEIEARIKRVNHEAKELEDWSSVRTGMKIRTGDGSGEGEMTTSDELEDEWERKHDFRALLEQIGGFDKETLRDVFREKHHHRR